MDIYIKLHTPKAQKNSQKKSIERELELVGEQGSSEILSFRLDMLLYPIIIVNCHYLYKHVQDQQLKLPEWMETEPPRANRYQSSCWQFMAAEKSPLLEDKDPGRLLMTQ